MQGVSAESLSLSERRLSLAAVIASFAAMGLMWGLMLPLLALILERDGVDTALNGLNAAMASLAILVAGPFVPRIIHAVGLLPSLHIGIAVVAGAILLMAVFPGIGPWLLLRFVFGLGVGLFWVGSETWINTVAREESRGRIMGAYMTALMVGLAGGPLIIAAAGIDGILPFLIGAGLMAASAVPLVLARRLAPSIPPTRPIRLRQVVLLAPTVMATIAAAGFTDMAIITLYPLYALRSGFSQDAALLMLSVYFVGSLALQLPIGWLADHLDRRRILMLCAGVGVVGPLMLPFVLHIEVVLWPLLFLWGGAVVGLYTVGLTLLGQSFPAAQLARAVAVFVMFYTTGGVIGPVVAGGAMEVAGPSGLPFALAVVCAVLLAVVGLGTGSTRRTREGGPAP